MTSLQTERPRRKPRARKIEGVTITPQWHWSPWYAAAVRRSMKGLPGLDEDWIGRPSPKRRYEGRALEYARWLAHRDGTDLKTAAGERANRFEFVWEDCEYGKATIPLYVLTDGRWRVTGYRRKTRPTFIKAVSFYYQAPGQHGQWYAGGHWKGVPIERQHVATIEIPNYDFTPSVVEAPAEQPSERRAA